MKQAVLLERFHQIRKQSLKICEALKLEDYTIQGASFVSPPKWHLGHTTWFFDAFILKKHLNNYQAYNSCFFEIFNSYYKTMGKHWIQANRGQLSRPTVEEVCEYRSHIDCQINDLLKTGYENEEFFNFLEIGLNHEQQHQELLLMDIQYNFSLNPIDSNYSSVHKTKILKKDLKFLPIDEGIYEIGHESLEFCYDNELPRHKTYIYPFAIANRLVTNAEFLEFMNDGAYNKAELWLSDAWNWLTETGKNCPLYWLQKNGQWFRKSLTGIHELVLNEPVSHISFFEGDAYARWKGLRLPTEQEWEAACGKYKNTIKGERFLEDGIFAPGSTDANGDAFHGGLWEWTNSSYLSYPRYKVPEKALGEYNSKFMNGQRVLRGGCFATPRSHYRDSYRNFYLPEQAWMFSGLRLAKDV